MSEYQAINTVLFIVLIAVVLITLISIIKFSKSKPGKQVKSLRAKFIELEKDFRWRRLKIIYLVVSALIVLTVIGSLYGTDYQAPLQTAYDFEVERAKDRTGAAFAAIVVTLLLWSGYFTILPVFHRLITKTKNYLRNPEESDIK